MSTYIKHETAWCPGCGNFMIDPDSPCKKRWTPSRNLKKPIITKTIVKADSWRKTPKIWKNYTLEDLYTGYSDYTGYPYRKYSMIRKE